MPTLEAQHLSVSVDRNPKDVYEYIATPEKFGEWAEGLSKGLTRSGDAWVGDSPLGRLSVRFAPRNPFGVVDHHVTTPDGQVVYVPLRVIANGSGSEVIFTNFRLPAMSDADFERDKAAVRKDLATLKKILEAK